MTDIDSGGPAFTSHVEKGLSKREWLAGMALQGLLSNPSISIEKSDFVEAAFIFADAIIFAEENGTHAIQPAWLEYIHKLV